MEQGLVSTAGGVIFPIQVLSECPCPVLLRDWMRCHSANLSMPSSPYWSYFDQRMIQINHLLSVAIRINCLARFQQQFAVFKLVRSIFTYFCH